MTDQTTLTEATAAAPGRPLRPSEPASPQEFGIVYSHASEDTGGLVAGSYPDALSAGAVAAVILAAGPGLEAVLVSRTADTDWADGLGRTPREIIQAEWAAPRSRQPRLGGHLSRSFGGPDPFTADCPCPVAPCGFATISPIYCPQHSFAASKTIRAWHPSTECTGAHA